MQDLARKMAQPFRQPSLTPLVREKVEQIRQSCRTLIAEHKDPVAPLRVDLALALACENYAKAARWVPAQNLEIQLKASAETHKVNQHRQSCRTLIAEHKDPVAPLRVDLALALACEKYAKAARCIS